MSYSKIGLTIMDWIDYKPNVGVEMLTITGLPGWGKTNMALNLIYRCVQRGEILVIPGDRFCEWKHFTRYSKVFKKIKIVVPKNNDIFYHGKGLKKMKDEMIHLDYKKLDVMDLIGDDTNMLVIYDAHLPIGERAWLWTNVVDQLLNRHTHINKSIALLFNEAGVLFPENASGDHWKACDKFSEIIVDTRKGLVRPVFISQLQSEVKSTIRKKAMFKIFRKGWAGRDEPKPLRKAVPFAARNEYHLSIGGLYVRYNIVDKFKEVKETWKMIPTKTNIINNKNFRGSMNERDGSESTHSQKSDEKVFKFHLLCQLCGYSWTGRSPQPAKCPKCRKSEWNGRKVSKKQTGG